MYNMCVCIYNSIWQTFQDHKPWVRLVCQLFVWRIYEGLLGMNKFRVVGRTSPGPSITRAWPEVRTAVPACAVFAGTEGQR